MAGTSLNFDISGLSDVQQMLGYMIERDENTEPLMQAIGHEGMQQTLRRFDAQVDPQGIPWVPSKAALKAGRKTLIDTRHFRDETFSSEATRTEATWGTNAVQGRIFQLGGDIKMPAREGKIRLRTNRDGSLLRQADIARMGPPTKRQLSLAVFAKATHKLAKAVDFKSSAFTIHVVARSFLGVNASDQRTFTDLVHDYFGPRGAA